ncbi:MAG: bifunctional nuclease family protein [Candidatus Abyssobacteria bacterium SURF_17]|uniref:Bifunctional nuclease family protein n=1 Tax=Candidatus Abyssobacteria bacterium SURF_17 TaxID=2093361 RepID=A0A419EN20_9BACT|nr:MAG: bifunctional nuclease family protein [Candidatus Abyssubacteria bacterium SURF_17]
MAMIEMRLDGVMYDVLKRPIVILRHEDRILPILVGNAEAFAIANGIEKVEMPRPMTHDLITFILKGFQTNLQSVQVYKLEGGTFYAYLILTQETDGTGDLSIIKIDCRPSDAIAIAVRMSSPIFVEEEVLNVAGQDSMPQEDSGSEEEEEGEGDFLE